MKRILIFLIIFMFLLSCGVMAKDEFLSVVDDALMISEETERYIYTRNKNLSEETGARIIFATVEDSRELSPTEYSNLMYEDLGVEHIGRNNCIFILLCKEDKDYCLKVSDGISAALTQSYAQKCLVDNLEEDFDKGDYDSAVIKTFNAFAGWYGQEYNIDMKLTEDMSGYKNIIKTEKEKKLLKNILIAVSIAVVVVVLIVLLVRHRRKKKKEKLLRRRRERRRRYTQALR